MNVIALACNNCGALGRWWMPGSRAWSTAGARDALAPLGWSTRYHTRKQGGHYVDLCPSCSSKLVPGMDLGQPEFGPALVAAPKAAPPRPRPRRLPLSWEAADKLDVSAWSREAAE